MYPIFAHFESTLQNHEPLVAYQWAKTGGAVMVADVMIPSDEDFSAKATMAVFDAVGNLVYDVANHGNVIPYEWVTQSSGGDIRQLVFYWNGITNDMRKAAPGIYRIVIYLDLKNEQKKYRGNVGIGR
jgi:hypothetical protein